MGVGGEQTSSTGGVYKCLCDLQMLRPGYSREGYSSCVRKRGFVVAWGVGSGRCTGAGMGAHGSGRCKVCTVSNSTGKPGATTLQVLGKLFKLVRMGGRCACAHRVLLCMTLKCTCTASVHMHMQSAWAERRAHNRSLRGLTAREAVAPPSQAARPPPPPALALGQAGGRL